MSHQVFRRSAGTVPACHWESHWATPADPRVSAPPAGAFHLQLSLPVTQRQVRRGLISKRGKSKMIVHTCLTPASIPAPTLPTASTTASIFSSSTMATLSSVFLRFSWSFLISSRKRFSLVGFSWVVGVTELATLVVEAGSTEVGEVGEPPVQSCSTVMFFKLSRIFSASFNSLKPREAPSLPGFSAPFTAPPAAVQTQADKMTTKAVYSKRQKLFLWYESTVWCLIIDCIKFFIVFAPFDLFLFFYKGFKYIVLYTQTSQNKCK